MAIADREDQRRLAERASQGDRQAFEELYQRYGQSLFDFALRTTHDVALAAYVLESTFVRAAAGLSWGSSQPSLRAWLLGIAREAAIDAIRHRSSIPTGGHQLAELEQVDFGQVDAERLAAAGVMHSDQHLADLAWSAASSLTPKDYMLLDMHLRQGLSEEEIAAAGHLRPGPLHEDLARLMVALDEAVTYTVLLRRDRFRCAALDALLTDADEVHVDSSGRERIAEHLASCAECSARRRQYPSPAAVFSALAPIPLPEGASQWIWRRIAARLSSGDVPPAPARQWRIPAARKFAFPIGGVLIVALVIAGVLGVRSIRNTPHDPGDVRSASHQPGQPSASPLIAVTWSRQPDAQAFAIRWSQEARDLPEAVAMLPGDATGATSPALAPGTWYFHLRTQNRAGHWTSTVHLGPFIISPPPPVPTATATASPTAVQTIATAGTEPAGALPVGPSSTATRPAATATAVRPRATPTLAKPIASARSSASAVPKPAASPTAAAAKPVAASAGAAPASTSTAVKSPAATATPACPPFGSGTLTATPGAGNKVALSWTASGGCGPYKGSISARYQQDASPYASYPISQLSGTLTDSPPQRCQGAFSVIYSLTLQDASGQTTSATATATLVWSC